MTRFSDAALLKGDYAKMLKEPPQEAEWNKIKCDDPTEAAAQSIAKQIFAFQQQIDQEKEKLEVTTFSSLGPIKVMGVMPIEGDMMRIDGVQVTPDGVAPVSIIQSTMQLSLTFTKAPVQSANPGEEPDDDDGLQIGFVIFDELNSRKKSRDAAKRKKSTRKAKAKK